ncbi:hypothetical protein B5M42_004480 [Paenibacillus athensensis]|uniref:Uncharacterized protein n=1 Tax=Paenibacillus athensensis TaxID=1967502 RepID=A0A4Y8PRM7_9BACL|nr:hypothetical protein [Paenibacillus athensensis]MCD1258095.1 hypothetical protein [Paenibacillus athensensis]
MSVFRFTSAPHTAFCSSHIDAVQLVFTNSSSNDFDLLIQGFNGTGLFFLGLTHLEAASSPLSVYQTADIPTHAVSFELLLVTNVECATTASVLLFAKQKGQTVAIATNADFEIGG